MESRTISLNEKRQADGAQRGLIFCNLLQTM